jgi:hypothetical protein
MMIARKKKTPKRRMESEKIVILQIEKSKTLY